MPLVRIEKYNDHQVIGLWKIEEEVEELKSQLDLAKEEGYKDISHEAKLKEFFTARLLTKLVCESISYDYKGIRKDEFGKPWMKESDYYLSVTHCYPMVAVIIDKYHEVGIDLERSREQISRISYRFMSDEEYNHSQEADYQLIMWAAKEALYKLHGRKSLEFRSQIIIDPFEVSDSGRIKGRIIDNGIENHDLYYQFLNGEKYVLMHSTQ